MNSSNRPRDIDIKIHIENHPGKIIERKISSLMEPAVEAKDKKMEKEIKAKLSKEKWVNYCKEFLCCEFGVFSVYILTKYALFNSVFAVSSLMLIVGLLFPKLSIVFLSGGFASVMNPETHNNPGFLVFSGAISFTLYRLTLKLFLNIGGRPGTIAYLSNLTTFLFVYLVSLSNSYEYYPMDYVVDYNYFKALNVYIYTFGPLITAFSSLCVYFLAEYLTVLIALTHRVVAYALVCMFECMYLLTFTTEYRKIIYSNSNTEIPLSYGQMLIHFVHIGTLSGLTLKTRYRENGQNAALHYCLAALLCGFIGIGFLGVLIFGGKHGITAFIGNLIYIYSLEFLFPIKEQEEIELSKKGEEEVIKEQVQNEIYNEINKEIKVGMSSTKIIECHSDDKDKENNNAGEFNNNNENGNNQYNENNRINCIYNQVGSDIKNSDKSNEHNHGAYEAILNTENNEDYKIKRKEIKEQDDKSAKICSKSNFVRGHFDNLSSESNRLKIESFSVEL